MKRCSVAPTQAPPYLCSQQQLLPGNRRSLEGLDEGASTHGLGLHNLVIQQDLQATPSQALFSNDAHHSTS